MTHFLVKICFSLIRVLKSNKKEAGTNFTLGQET